MRTVKRLKKRTPRPKHPGQDGPNGNVATPQALAESTHNQGDRNRRENQRHQWIRHRAPRHRAPR